MKSNPSTSALDLTTPATAFAYLETIDSPTVEIAGAGDQLSPVDDAIRTITGESSNSFALSHNCWMWSTPELIRVLAEYLPSAPLNICPPTGVTGTVLPDSPVKDTPAKGLDIPLRHCACGTPFDATGTCPACYSDDDLYVRPELDALEDAPASPIGVTDLGKAASDLLEFLEQYPHQYGTDISGYVEAVQEAIPSHAAKDAKIKALTEAGENFASDFEDWTAFKDVDQWERLQESLAAFRAALALPSA